MGLKLSDLMIYASWLVLLRLRYYLFLLICNRSLFKALISSESHGKHNLKIFV